MLILGHIPCHFPAANLLIQSVQQLLTGGGSGKGGTVVFGPPETAEVESPSGVRLKGTPIRSNR